MTKYKEFMRAKDIMLQCDFVAMSDSDFDPMPYTDFYDVEFLGTEVLDNGVMAASCSYISGREYVVVDRHGEYNYYNSHDYQTYIEDSRCDPELMCWLYDNGFTDRALNHLMIHYSPLYSSYGVYVAFLHVRAGIMDESAFYKLVSKRCQQTINFYHIDTVLN